MILNYINWNANPEIFSLGSISLRWYGLLFASGFLIGLYMVRKMYQAEGAPEKWLDSAFIHIVLGAVIGARLGHVFFYDWDYYKEHLIEIPQTWHGGLASHGGAFGIFIGLWLFSRNVSKKPMVWMLDKIAVPTALAGFFIRMGNLMNSEILGKPTDVSWAFIFVREGDGLPRHPTQLYESLAYLVIFFILYFVYWKTDKRHQPGYLFGAFMILVWGVRFFLEFTKESQGGFESALGQSLSTGQWLSIPFVLIGAYFVFRPWYSLKKI